MTERDDLDPNVEDDTYVIEDSGETLETFDLDAEVLFKFLDKPAHPITAGPSPNQPETH